MENIKDLFKIIGVEEELVTSEVENFASVTIEAIKLYAKKNHDYGDSFNKGMDAIGNAYGIGRLFDKMNRLIALCGKEDENKVQDEKYDDTLIDLACYSMMIIAHRKAKKQEETKNIKFD